MENRFNLIDEPWIPVVDFGRISLKQLFSNSAYRRLSGDPVQKIALLKLLFAIAQAACTPEDDECWQKLRPQGMAESCLDYLQRWHDRFYLYGDRPFLQMPAVSAAAVQRFGAVLPQIATGNTTLLNQSQKEQPLDDADKALLLVRLAGFALAGKKTDNSIVLTPGYTGKQNDKGKPASGRAGPSLAHRGLLHSLFMGDNLQQTLWFNLLTRRDLAQKGSFPEGVGTAVWERMPQGEDCEVARELKASLQGRLVPLCRFCLLTADGLHYSEGIQHPSYLEHVVDPTVSVDFSDKKPKVLWVDPEKRPWRQITALLNISQSGNNSRFETLQLSESLLLRIRPHAPIVLWSGGLKVSSNAGEQYASGGDDYVESEIPLSEENLSGGVLGRLTLELQNLDTLTKNLYGAVSGYFNAMKMEGQDLAKPAAHVFWQWCERDFQPLIDSLVAAVEGDNTALQALRRRYASYQRDIYDAFCPRETARQIKGWASHRPNAAPSLSEKD